MMINWLLTGFAICLLLAGIILLVSPIPVGIVLIAISLSLLISTSPRTRKRIRTWRMEHPGFNQKLHRIEEKIGDKIKFISHALLKTRPDSTDRQKHEQLSDK